VVVCDDDLHHLYMQMSLTCWCNHQASKSKNLFEIYVGNPTVENQVSLLS